MNNILRIGVNDYSSQKFDSERATQMINEAYDILERDYKGFEKVVVSGLTDLGIPGIAYRVAVNRGWKTVGIACTKADRYACFPVDEKIIVGENWGDESQTFLNSIDVLVRIGGGKQTMKECAEWESKGKPFIQYDLEAIV